ncbi:NADPH-dependent FMN reductase [Streptomonospora alba]|uniref:NADPH-dependent FMN reductase n=1 Tax=Streptomonospora alba TaxID=183763 RepID=UPI002379BD08|nr:NADPH-dependent FMN reductase [Streptomonospora alba]
MRADVLCIQGSLGHPSRTAVLTELVRRTLEQLGARTDVLDLREHRLPQVDVRYHGSPEDPPDPAVGDLLHRVRAADAMVWASPVYHNSYSAALKNALDHLAIADVRGKPLALCGNGGRRASGQAADHLRIVARGLHGIAVPLVTTTADGDFRRVDGEYRIAARETIERAVAMCQQLLDYTDRFRTAPQDAVGVAAPASEGAS